jgi:NAD(P)-dependent dehydrogenase (short-subunit alcohol dehydrogenase family)
VNDLIEERAEAVVADIEDAGGWAVAIDGDVASREGAAAVVARAAEALDGLDGLVNNAGIVRFGTVTTITDEDWDATMTVDFASVAYVSKAAFEPLADGGGGSIVNLASIAAEHPSITVGSYSPAKAAVVALTKQLALDWGPYGIRVNAVGPGLISGTSMTEVADSDPRIAERRNRMVPLRRTGRPEDVADVIVFLLSDSARYVSGQFMMIDGGLSTTLLEYVPRPGEQDEHRGHEAPLD